MGWYEKPAVRAAIPPAKALWQVCPRCGAYVPRAEWRDNSSICPRCNYHGRLSARDRVAMLADAGTFAETDRDVTYADRLSFKDASGAYSDKAEAAVAKTGETESILTGTAKMDGIPVMLGAMEFAFFGGSLGTGTGERIARACDRAVAENRPLVICSASGGARMQEGILSLMQMAKTSAAVERVKRARVPYISILTDPTYGGVSASFAMLGDINITEPKSLIGFAGRRVIENTIRQKLPPDFQTGEYLLEHGFMDSIVERRQLKAFTVKMLHYFGY